MPETVPTADGITIRLIIPSTRNLPRKNTKHPNNTKHVGRGLDPTANTVNPLDELPSRGFVVNVTILIQVFILLYIGYRAPIAWDCFQYIPKFHYSLADYESRGHNIVLAKYSAHIPDCKTA